jgi:hypothetical protein
MLSFPDPVIALSVTIAVMSAAERTTSVMVFCCP